MARHARIKETYGYFYIHQTSNNDRPLFYNDEDRTFFLEILKRVQKKFSFRLYAYCILSPNAYHLVINTNGSDLSSIMKSINIGYAMYAKCPGRLFKDRYKSQLLAGLEEVQEKIKAIHQKSGTIFNSFCHYDISQPLTLDWITPLQTEGNPNISDNCSGCLQSLEEAKFYLDKIAAEGVLSTSDLLRDKTCRNQLIKDFRRQSTLSLKELGQLFGGLDESTICKILNQ